ncbi:thiamine pyrophosphokinase [Parathielavia appendiculata]|uniref:Thiamine pyrophosphokinase n=1 Tax=Parathielavia appendiculata TaxID=2587402 RepID=A0AAN6Z1H7_9PEZI|nr:thiamine pyrophosphokinase [Parathielavia appendiculata]
MDSCNVPLEAGQLDTFEWHPADLIRPPADGQNPYFALIVLNQPLQTNRSVIRQLWNNAYIRIAADGGANRLYDAAGKHGDGCFDDLHSIIGDLDSLTTTTQAYYETRNADIIRDPDQESTDFGKCVAYIRQHHQALPAQHQNVDEARTHARPPPDIVAIGGLGGRVDQGLSQLHHLYLFQTDPRYADGRLYLFSGESLTFLLKPGRHIIRVRNDEGGEEKEKGCGGVFGKHVGILPIGGTSRITTKGLEWDVTDWETRFGGRVSTSNHVLPDTKVVEVRTTEEVLFTIALTAGEGQW